MVSRLLQSETQANCNKKKLFCDMIAEKKTKHYINNNKLIEKTSLSCFLNQFVFLGLRIKKKKNVLVCHGISQSLENFQRNGSSNTVHL